MVGLSQCEERCLPSPSTGRVKLIRVCLGVADGLSALSSVCIRGSQPQPCSYHHPQHHSNTLPALFGLYQPELSSSVLHAFVLAALSVCMCGLCHSVSRTLNASIKKPYCSPRGILSAPCQSTSPASSLPSSYWTLIFCILPLKISLMTILLTKNIAGSYCFPGIQMIWGICINRL